MRRSLGLIFVTISAIAAVTCAERAGSLLQDAGELLVDAGDALQDAGEAEAQSDGYSVGTYTCDRNAVVDQTAPNGDRILTTTWYAEIQHFRLRPESAPAISLAFNTEIRETFGSACPEGWSCADNSPAPYQYELATVLAQGGNDVLRVPCGTRRQATIGGVTTDSGHRYPEVIVGVRTRR